ncbi:MAG: PEP-CTERM sorting domain-containing protein [Armatimonadaceae bacterium]
MLFDMASFYKFRATGRSSAAAAGAIAAALASVSAPATAQTPRIPSTASLVLNFQETGGNVVGTLSGNVLTSALTFKTSGGPAGGTSVIYGGGGSNGIVIGTGTSSYNDYEGFTWDNASASFAGFKTGAPSLASSGSSNYFEMNEYSLGPQRILRMILPSSYVDLSALSGSSTWTGQTFSSMGIATGTYRWTYGSSNQHEFKVVVAAGTTGGGGAVPEPGEWAAMGILGAGLTGLVLRKRRTA